MNIRTHIFSIVFIFFFSKIAYTQVVITSQSPSEINILNKARLSSPLDTALTIENILDNPSLVAFKEINEEKPNISFTSSHYWLTFDIYNNSEENLNYYLETARPIIDNVECYIISETGSIETQFSGDNLPLNKKTVQHHKTLFKLNLSPQKKYTVYIHYKSDGEVLSLPLILYTPDRFIELSHGELLVFGLFYGVLLLAAITYLFFYFGMADKSFLFYSLYVISIGLLQFALDGLFHQYIMPGSGWLYLRSLILIAIISPFFMSLYVVTYLKIDEYFTFIPKVFKALNIALGILFILVLVSTKAFELSYPIANLLGLLVLSFIIISIISLWIKYKTIDWLFSIGILCLVVGFTIFILNNLGIIPNSIITEYSTKLGTGLEVTFLSLSMANRIWLLKSEKEKIQEVALQKSEEANELKSNFMSMMSHELRTPLNAIMSISDVMRKEVEDEKIKNNFDLIKYSSVSLLSSVNDILDFSKIQKGELTLQVEEFNPDSIIKQAKGNWEIQAKNKGLNFNYTAHNELPELIKGDASRLTQILSNLLSNAVKFTSKGSVDLVVDYKLLEDDTTLLNITITDTGIGIPKEKQSSVFESFIQETINDKRKYGGFGLGLSIVKRLIELQKGTINLQSEINKGTTFTVELPYILIKTSAKKQNIFPKDRFDLLGNKILVVEDNDVNQFIMETLLSKWENTEIALADNGKEALDKLEEEHFDVILMDLQMPIMDGYEATTEIRKGTAGDNNKEIPIIALTADVMESSKQKAKNVGMDDYMTKPVDQALLYEKITFQLSA